jgi:hypothetical protein
MKMKNLAVEVLSSPFDELEGRWWGGFAPGIAFEQAIPWSNESSRRDAAALHCHSDSMSPRTSFEQRITIENEIPENQGIPNRVHLDSRALNQRGYGIRRNSRKVDLVLVFTMVWAIRAPRDSSDDQGRQPGPGSAEPVLKPVSNEGSQKSNLFHVWCTSPAISAWFGKWETRNLGKSDFPDFLDRFP